MMLKKRRKSQARMFFGTLRFRSFSQSGRAAEAPKTFAIAAAGAVLLIAAAGSTGCVNQYGIQNPPGSWTYKQDREAPIDRGESPAAGPQSRAGTRTSELYGAVGGSGGYMGTREEERGNRGLAGGNKQPASGNKVPPVAPMGKVNEETWYGGLLSDRPMTSRVANGINNTTTEPKRPADQFELRGSQLNTTGEAPLPSASELSPVRPTRAAGAAGGAASRGAATTATTPSAVEAASAATNRRGGATAAGGANSAAAAANATGTRAGGLTGSGTTAGASGSGMSASSTGAGGAGTGTSSSGRP
jgi:hypothetical protein